jgi:hypothetical protein
LEKEGKERKRDGELGERWAVEECHRMLRNMRMFVTAAISKGQQKFLGVVSMSRKDNNRQLRGDKSMD